MKKDFYNSCLEDFVPNFLAEQLHERVKKERKQLSLVDLILKSNKSDEIKLELIEFVFDK